MRSHAQNASTDFHVFGSWMRRGSAWAWMHDGMLSWLRFFACWPSFTALLAWLSMTNQHQCLTARPTCLCNQWLLLDVVLVVGGVEWEWSGSHCTMLYSVPWTNACWRIAAVVLYFILMLAFGLYVFVDVKIWLGCEWLLPDLLIVCGNLECLIGSWKYEEVWCFIWSQGNWHCYVAR